MENLTYKGYTGEYQRYDDGVNASSYFAGDIPAVKRYAQVLFEGESIEELIEDFHNAVDDCIANGYAPKEQTHRVSIPSSLYLKLASNAKQKGMSVSCYVSKALASVVL